MTQPEANEPVPGGARELIRLAWPLVLSSSFWTIQIFIDRLFLSWQDADAAGAVMMGATIFWTPFILLQATAGYVSTFVAQYLGAGRPKRVGPVVWQGLYFAVAAGLGFLLLVPLAGPLVEAIGHPPHVREMEAVFLRCLCFVALPGLVTATVNGFFSGRSQSRMVLLIDGTGATVTALLDYVLIFGKLGLPALGVQGAGLATVGGAWASALLGLGLMFRAGCRREFDTLAGRGFDRPLFRRLMRFGLPSGMQWALDTLAFGAIIVIIGWLGEAELAASGIALTINALAFIPMIGLGQATAILVGRRLGEDRPDVAERSTWTACLVTSVYMGTIALLYATAPSLFVAPFRSDADPAKWEAVASVVRVLLLFVAMYSLFDGINIVFAFALRGAGDTRFVTLVSLTLAWPVMVVPAWLSYRCGGGLYGIWTAASVYIALQALCFMLRFRGGKWKSMRVIEAAPPELIEDEAGKAEKDGTGEPEGDQEVRMAEA